MKTLHKGTVNTDTIMYSWVFEDAEDHEHPYILTVTVGEHTHSEGCDRDIGESAALVKADNLAREIFSNHTNA